MPTPSGLVTKQELIDAQLDTAHLGRVVNSKDASGAPISTSTNRTGGVNKTLDALEAEAVVAFDDQRDQFETTFNAQFTYKRIGNISDYAGQSLPEADKLNSYQYPDDSDAWYAPVQGQSFPITIPADPTVSGSGWVLTASPNVYRGLWPDTGGSANKGETWQTQTGGTPTGQYFTALQNTTTNPIGDDVNWRNIVGKKDLDSVYEDSKNYYIDVTNYPDVKGDLSVDCSVGFKAAYDHAVSLGFDLFIPATYGGGYFIKDIEMAGVASGYAKGIKVFGGGIVNSLGAVATVVHPKENSAFISREIGDSFYNLCFRNWTGKAGVAIQSVDIPGKSLVLASNPWELSGGSPITWDHTITSTDGTTYSNFLQFAAYGSWVSDTVVVNGDGTVTISNIKGSNGTLDSDFLSGLATSIERFSSYAHFETVPVEGLLNELGSIHLDIAENSIFNNLWFTQVRKAFSHDLGSGAGPNTNIGNLGLYSNIIVDGANDFMTGVDLRGSSQENLHGGQFSNVQFFSCRRVFNGRRLENLTFASCVFNYSQTLFRATDAYNLQWTGGEIGWGTGTGFIENVVEIPGQCFGLNITGAKWGRHSTGNAIKLGQVRDLNLSGNNHQSISESNVVGNEFLVVTDFINSSYIGGNSISNEVTSSDYITADFTALDALSKIADTNFAQPIQAFGASDVIADLSSGTSVYQFMYSLAKFKDGGSAAFEDVNSGYVSVSNKNIHKYGGTLNPSVVFTMPNFNAIPNSAEQIILDFSAVNFNGQSIAVSSSGGSAITTVSAQGVVTLTKHANSFIATT